ncbi:hypothetical protein [Chroococcidiopsis sp [FACHB-1243]]|uniref:hypothetical protein n=1 Tax=Chroococcidiopsis sp. [FACHB-1243] TaxID=2692781 RepID=UPI001F5527E4|nr:hypothetical protein [Chroococcidiopsis sp. [FACHB-1243]]
MSSPLPPAGIVGWCMCRAQANPAVRFSKRKLLVGRNIGSLWFVTDLIPASQPQIFGNPDLDAAKTGKFDIAVAVIGFSLSVIRERTSRKQRGEERVAKLRKQIKIHALIPNSEFRILPTLYTLHPSFFNHDKITKDA